MDAKRNKEHVHGETPCFLILLAVGSAVLDVVIIRSGDFGVWVALLMWVPGLAALATRLVVHRSLGGLGWSWGGTRLSALAYAVPALVGLCVYGAVWLLGLGGVSTAALAEAVSQGLGFALPWTAALVVLMTLGFAESMLTAAGEEIGWAGFLTRAFADRLAATRTSLLVAGVWTIWHAPLILFTNYYQGDNPAIALACFTVMAIGFSFVRTWLILASGSLWTASFLHASHNLFVQGVFDTLTVEQGITKTLTTEFGVGLAAAYAVVAMVCSRAWPKRSGHAAGPLPGSPSPGRGTRGKNLRQLPRPGQ